MSNELTAKPFPSNTEKWFEGSKKPVKKSLNDRVGDALPNFIGDEKLNGYLRSLTNDDAVSGKLQGDQLLAADRLKQLAADDTVIANAKAWDVMNAIKVVLRRNGLSVQQRLAAPPSA